jgi:Histidine kinase-like ATPase domain
MHVTAASESAARDARAAQAADLSGHGLPHQSHTSRPAVPDPLADPPPTSTPGRPGPLGDPSPPRTGPATGPGGSVRQAAAGIVHDWTALALPASPRAAGRFRRHAVGATRRWGLHPDSGDVIETCVSELVTNAIVHGVGRDVLMMLYYTGDSVLTEVFGYAVDSPAIPATARSDNAEGGRGLLIVDTLAKDWGSEHTGLGLLRVWASIAVAAEAGGRTGTTRPAQ